MKISRLFILFFFCILVVSSCDSSKSNQPTTVYMVRHAEKDLTDLSAQDPPLTDAGYLRARHLAERLKNEKIDGILSTKYQRNRNTVQALADAKGVKISEYEWHDHEGVRKVIMNKHAGQTVVFCGHGDNILPVIELLGAKPPMDSIPTFEYDNIFKVVVNPDGSAIATVEKFE